MDQHALHHVPVFKAGTDGYVTFRIPAIETAPDGRLLAFAEARKHNYGDPGHEGQEIDLVLKTSSDGGQTWSQMQVIEAPGKKWSAGNPATVVDTQTGRVWLSYLRCRPGAGSQKARPGTDDILNLARWSDDDGSTWSEAVNLTAICRDMDDGKWRCTVPGPGGAIQDHQGRLVFACWSGAEARENFAVFSEDHGQTWERGAFVPGDVHGNENQITELVDGRLLMDIRQSEGEHRWLSKSTDGGRTWSKPQPAITVSPVACAIKRLTLAETANANRLVWTGPSGPGRENLIARVSRDEGQSFGPERPIATSKAAYSDLTVLANGTLGVLWEKGESNAYETLTFTALPLSFLEP